MPLARTRFARILLIALTSALSLGLARSGHAVTPADFVSGSLFGFQFGGSGPLNTALYTAPMGKYFVLTDLEYSLTWANSGSGNRVEGPITLNEGMNERWSTFVSGFQEGTTLNEGRSMLSKTFATGIAFNQGQTASVTHQPWLNAVSMSSVYWRIAWSGYTVSNTLTGVNDPIAPGKELWLGGAVPNPLDSETRFGFNLGSGSHITLRVVDVNGRVVRRLFDGRKPAGEHAVTWDARDDRGRSVAAGVYFVELVADKQHRAQRAVVIN